MTAVDEAATRVRAKIGAYLEAWPDVTHRKTDDEERFVVSWGSIVVVMTPGGRDEGTGTLGLYSTLLRGVETSNALYRYVSTNQPWLGQLEVTTNESTGETNVIAFLGLLADYLDEEEFRSYVRTFCSTADTLDSKLGTIFGGRRADP